MTGIFLSRNIRGVMSEGKRAEIRRFYKMARTAVDKTQLEVEMLARLNAGQFWRIENGFAFPDEDERPRLAKVLKVNEADLPSENTVAKAS